MALFGFLMACFLFSHFNRRFRHYRREIGDQRGSCMTWDHKWHGKWDHRWGREWERHQRRTQRGAHRMARRAAKAEERWGWPVPEPPKPEAAKPPSPEEEALRRARRRAAAEAGFYGHLMSYLGVIAFLALINFFTTWY